MARYVSMLCVLLVLTNACDLGQQPQRPVEPIRPSNSPMPAPDLTPLEVSWHDEFELALDNGWTVTPCEGDAPMVCVSDGQHHVGVVEILDYPVAHTPLLADLRERAQEFLTSLRTDRASTCPFLRVDTEAVTDVSFAGQDGVRIEVLFRAAEQNLQEHHLVYWTARQGTHYTIAASGSGPNGCAELLGEFDPADLREFAPFLDRIVADTPLPAASHFAN